jgi:hypothetical protein
MKASSARASQVPNDATEDLTRADVEGREQRACPAPTVLELVADDATMTHVDRVTARQRLHRLLVDAHDDSVLRRVPVKAADPRDLHSKVRIRGMKPVADTVRAPATRSQHASDRTAAYVLAPACVQGVGEGRRSYELQIASSIQEVARWLPDRHTRGPASRFR